jgi:hypothetical protein
VKIIGYVILNPSTFRRHRVHNRIYESRDRAASVISGSAEKYNSDYASRRGYAVFPAFVPETP